MVSHDSYSIDNLRNMWNYLCDVLNKLDSPDNDNENKELNKRGRGRPRVEIKDVSIVSDSVESDIEEIEVKRSEIDGRRVLESKTGEIYCERSLELIGRRVLDIFRPLNSL